MQIFILFFQKESADRSKTVSYKGKRKTVRF